MRQILENLETLFDDVMAFPTLDIGDKAHAAGIMFMLWIVETLSCWLAGWRIRRLHFNIHSKDHSRLSISTDFCAVDAKTV